MIKFSHVIFYVKNIGATVAFYEQAFGFRSKFFHEAGIYAELETGQTTVAFAHADLAIANLPLGYYENSLENKPAGCEITFTTDNVEKTLKRAIDYGAIEILPPTQKPWGQTVAYIRDQEGILIAICSEIQK